MVLVEEQKFYFTNIIFSYNGLHIFKNCWLIFPFMLLSKLLAEN